MAAHPHGQPLHHRDCPPDRLADAVAAHRAHHADAGPCDYVDDDDWSPESYRRIPAHPNLPEPARRQLVDDPIAASQLLDNPNLTTSEAGPVCHRYPAAAKYWAGNANADPVFIAATAEHQMRVARQRSQGEYRSEDPVLHLIAANPATPPDTLTVIATDWLSAPNPDRIPGTAASTLETVLGNRSCPPAAMAAALEAPRRPAPRRSPLRSDTPSWRETIAANPHTTDAVLARVDVADLGALPHYRFVAAHASSCAHARTLLKLMPHWTGNLADLLEAATLVHA